MNLRPRFGPGTVAMLVGLVAFGAYRAFTQPAPAAPRYLVADAQGRLRPAQRPAPPPLAKPEPARLASLDLGPEQRARIDAIDAAWAAEKRALEARMAREAAFLEGTAARSQADIQSRLSRYSELSRTYAARRERAWRDALAVLTPAQRAAAWEAAR